MTDVRLVGGQPGMRKIAVTKLIGERAGVRRAEAKEITDHRLGGTQPRISLRSTDEAERFLDEITHLGVDARLDTGRRDGPADTAPLATPPR